LVDRLISNSDYATDKAAIVVAFGLAWPVEALP